MQLSKRKKCGINIGKEEARLSKRINQELLETLRTHIEASYTINMQKTITFIYKNKKNQEI